MSKRKNIITLILSLISLLIIISDIVSSAFFSLFETSLLEYISIPILLFILFIPSILTIKYIHAKKNNDKYLDLTKFQNTCLFINISFIILAIIDYFYNVLFISELSSVVKYFSVFMYKYILLFELICLIAIIWINNLKKNRIKLSKSIVFKLINNWIFIIISTFILLSGDVSFMIVPLLFEIIIMITPIRKILYNKIFNIILLIINIILLILIFILPINIDITMLYELLPYYSII